MTKGILKNGLSARHAGGIKRYHVWPTIQTQDVAAHTWHVLRIYIEVFGPPEPDVTCAIQFHDLGELGSGDIPFDAKRASPQLRAAAEQIDNDSAEILSFGLWSTLNLNIEQKAQVKFCDLAEMFEFAVEEMRLGNIFYGLEVATKVLVELSRVYYHHLENIYPEVNTVLLNMQNELQKWRATNGAAMSQHHFQENVNG